MKCLLKIAFNQFLEKHQLREQALLLGLSGGPDSLALFYLMLDLTKEFRKPSPLRFAVAHVDHSWRPESSAEALILKDIVEKHGIDFHCKTLDPGLFPGNPQNIEELCREERFAFFRKLCSENGYHAVVLGHHKDDQSETVLKRILEGSSFLNFAGIKPITYIAGLKVARPLLNHHKKEIIAYLNLLNIPYFTDPTNSNPDYLRSRMRESILPLLSDRFGKEVSSNLYCLSQDVQELQVFLDQCFLAYSESIVIDSSGSYLDFSRGVPSTDFEIKYLIRKFCNAVNMPISRAQLQMLVPLVRNPSTGKQVINGTKKLCIHKNKIYFQRISGTSDFAVEAQ